ncbi:MAG: hypothetical protein V2A73_07505 [Pseudomonadota bacterium]
MGVRADGGPSLAWLVLVLAAAASATAGCGGSEETAPNPDAAPQPDATTTPEPYAPPAEGAPECELSADCPAGTHCDLGECVQSCNTEQACDTASVYCSERGRCSTTPADTDPPPEETKRAEVSVVGEPMVEVGEKDATVRLRLMATPASETVRYRIDPRVAWLRAAEPRGSFSDVLDVSLAVDRTGLATGVHHGTVVVHTSAGNVAAAYVLVQGVTGVYQGSLEYAKPRPLGSVPLRIEVVEESGAVKLRFDPTIAATIPSEASGAGVTASATWKDGKLTGSLVQRFAASDLGSERLFDREVGRDMRFELKASTGGGLEGTFEESWIGLLPNAVKVSGSIVLGRRLDRQPGSFVVSSPPSLPANPTVTPPALDAPCIEEARKAAKLLPGACDSDSSGEELVSCGNAIRAKGAKLESETSGLLINEPSRGYASFVDRCKTEQVSTDSATSSDSVACIRTANLVCAEALFAVAAGKGLSEGLQGIGKVASDYAAVGGLLLNDALVETFRAPYEAELAETAVEKAMLNSLDGGRTLARNMLQRAFGLHILDTLQRTPTWAAAAESYRPLRRLAHLLGRYRLAADERFSVKMRGVGVDVQTLRQEMSIEALNLQLAVVVLAAIEQAQAAPASPELGLFVEALTALGKKYIGLSETTDPLGLPPGYVEFTYDPLRTSHGSTNYEQVLDSHLAELAAAEKDEADALDTSRSFDTSVNDLMRELDENRRSVNSRLVSICGPKAGSPAEPELTACGQTSGEVASARNQLEEELQNVQIATTRIHSQDARVEAEIQRANQVYGIRSDTMVFVDQTGKQMDAVTWKRIHVETAQAALSAAASGSVAGLLGGAVSAGLNELRGRYEVQKERYARSQQMRIMESDREIEYLNAMASVKDMILQYAELTDDLTLAKIRALTAAIRINTLLEEVRSIKAEGDLAAAQATDPSRLANDPTIRVLRDRAMAKAMTSRESALRGIYLAARAFELETNTTFPPIATDLVPARRASQIRAFVDCMQSHFNEFRRVFGVPQSKSEEVSLRTKVLGIHGPMTDSVTGAEISAAEQFRRVLLSPSNLGVDGSVGFHFSTNIAVDNGIFSTGVCNDQLRSIQVKIIGNGLGDNNASIRLTQGGTSYVRSCWSGQTGHQDQIDTYQIHARTVEIQAGVNAYPTAAVADTQLFGRSVAASEWVLTIPPGSAAPSNADLDLGGIEDLVFQIEHSYITLSSSPLTYDPMCE